MSVNKHKPHVFVLPEDDANSELGVSFLLGVDHSYQTKVLPVAGGWKNVLDLFRSDHIAEMNRFRQRLMILLIDFDGKTEERLPLAKMFIPDNLTDRVFVLGVKSEPEDLKTSLGSYKTIGSNLAQDCREDIEGSWGHPLLRHNKNELERLRERVRPILFPNE